MRVTDNKTVERKRAITSSVLGSSIEWYDFYLYGVAATLIFNTHFFPEGTSPYVGTLLAFSVYAVGFAARPLGAIIFGHFGDRVGRKNALVVSLVLMGLSTFAVGLLPTYASWGIWASVALTLLRFAQGIGVGGEWAGAVLIVTEQSPAARRGFLGSLPQLGVAFGALAANGAFAFVSAIMPDAAFTVWGWRIPFLVSVVLVAVGTRIRFKLAESPEFMKLRAAGEIQRLPVATAIRTQPWTILKAAGIRIADVGNYYVWTTFALAYGLSLGLHQDEVLVPTLIASAISVLTLPLWGAISDKIGRRASVCIGAAAMAGLAFPFFWAVESGNWVLILLVLVIGINIGRDACAAPLPAYLTELFPRQVRYSGASLGSQLAAVFGGCAPLIATGLAGPGYDRIELVALFAVAMAALTLLAAVTTPETAVSRTGTDVLADAQTEPDLPTPAR